MEEEMEEERKEYSWESEAVGAGGKRWQRPVGGGVGGIFVGPESAGEPQ